MKRLRLTTKLALSHVKRKFPSSSLSSSDDDCSEEVNGRPAGRHDEEEKEQCSCDLETLPLQISNEWNVFTDRDLLRIYFLLTTTQSKEAVDRYFLIEDIKTEKQMRDIIFAKNKVQRVLLCSECAQDVKVDVNKKIQYSCSCEVEKRYPCELVFSDIEKRLKSLMDVFGDEIMRTQEVIRNGKISSSPMFHGHLKKLLLSENCSGRLNVHFLSGFDGIALKGNSKKKVWPFTLLPLDLEDRNRASIRAVMVAALYLGKKDPTSAVHDRIVRWACAGLMTHWKDLLVDGKLTLGVHDDPARRKVYGLKGHSSKGSCPFCINQGTRCKLFNGPFELRENHKNGHFGNFEDGLQNSNTYTHYHSIVPMWDSPIDLFHSFSEGVFDRLIDAFLGDRLIPSFASETVDRETEIKIPSKFKVISGKTKNITGSEKVSLFETLIVGHAMAGAFHPIVTVIVLAFHGLFRLMVSPESVGAINMHLDIDKICVSIVPIITQHSSILLNGPKAHQILFHLASCVEKYGSLLPMTSQSHEHAYHTLQRHLCPEITNGIGSCLLRNTMSLQEVHAEVYRRNQTDGFSSQSVFASKLVMLLQIEKQETKQKENDVPSIFKDVSEVNDKFKKVQYVNGLRFAAESSSKCDDSRVMFYYRETVQYGTVLGFLVSDKSEIRAIISPYILSDSNIENLAKRLIDENVSKAGTQDLLTALTRTSFGSLLRGVGKRIVLPVSSIIGHAVVISCNKCQIVLPFSFRPMLS